MSSPPPPSDIIASPPPGRARVIVTVFIAAYLLWQVAAPIAYFFRDDRLDERFAWRMFSATWSLKKSCFITVNEHVRSPSGNTTVVRNVDLSGIINDTWVQLLTYNRAAVVDRFLRTRCQDPLVTGVNFYQSCGAEERSSLPFYRSLTCTTDARSGTRGVQ